MKKVSGTRRLLAVVLTIAMLLQNSAGVLATDGANAVSDLSQEQSTEQTGVNAASEQMDANAEAQQGAGKQDGENADVSKKNEAPETAAPETQAPQTEAPQAEAPETTAPEIQATATEAPQTAAPETQATATDAPQTAAPETQASERETPQTSMPETQASTDPQETPGFTQPDDGVTDGTNKNDAGAGTETGSTADTNIDETGDTTGNEAMGSEAETAPTETAAPEQSGTNGEAGNFAEANTYTAQVENTAVQVKVRGEGILPEGCAMTAEAVTDVSDLGQTIAERLHEEGQALLGVEAFDITLLDENGAELHQLGGKVSVELEGLTVPEDAEQIRVYHMTEEGQPEQVKVLAKEELTDGVLRFETDHFSVYAVAYVKGEDLNAGIATIANEKVTLTFQTKKIDTEETEIIKTITVDKNSTKDSLKMNNDDRVGKTSIDKYYFINWEYSLSTTNGHLSNSKDGLKAEDIVKKQPNANNFTDDMTFTARFAPITTIKFEIDQPEGEGASVNKTSFQIEERYSTDDKNLNEVICKATSGTGATFVGWRLCLSEKVNSTCKLKFHTDD